MLLSVTSWMKASPELKARTRVVAMPDYLSRMDCEVAAGRLHWIVTIQGASDMLDRFLMGQMRTKPVSRCVTTEYRDYVLVYGPDFCPFGFTCQISRWRRALQADA